MVDLNKKIDIDNKKDSPNVSLSSAQSNFMCF